MQTRSSSRLVSNPSSNPTSSTNPKSESEAWDRLKDLLRACPHHGFLELHQLDTFYNALNSKNQDSLNSAARGNFLDKMPRECLAIIESKSKVHYLRDKPVVAKVSTTASTFGVSPDVAKLKDMVKALLLDKKGQNQSPAPVKAVEESCVFSLEGAAWIWLEKEPPRSIFTWDDLVSKFINKFFPPSKTTSLRNEITNFQQRFDESFSKA
nr:reverse transcriptase domain-containing protein [Tanacetum cinerariifolium]